MQKKIASYVGSGSSVSSFRQRHFVWSHASPSCQQSQSLSCRCSKVVPGRARFFGASDRENLCKKNPSKIVSFSATVRCTQSVPAVTGEPTTEPLTKTSGETSSAIAVNDVWFSWKNFNEGKAPASDGSDESEENFILKGCSLEVPRGQVWMLLGANGSGKSTLLKLLIGLVSPDRGSISVRAPVGFVNQNPDHQVFMPTAGSDVAFGLAATQDMPADELHSRVSEALSLVNLAGFENRPVYTLSGGQKQRVAIAGAVARRCNTLLLDEPTAFLDPPARRSLADHVRSVARSTGIAALWITHYFEELENCDGAILLEDGKVAMAGPAAEVKAYIRKKYSLQS